MTKMYIAILDEFPDGMTPTLVAHAILGAHLKFYEPDWEYEHHDKPPYNAWLDGSFKKVTVRVNQKEFDKIAALPDVHIAHENNTLGGKPSCVVVCPREEIPNVLKFAKLWGPKL
jgi:peptidyl-tRNA hydrolase